MKINDKEYQLRYVNHAGMTAVFTMISPTNPTKTKQIWLEKKVYKSPKGLYVRLKVGPKKHKRIYLEEFDNYANAKNYTS